MAFLVSPGALSYLLPSFNRYPRRVPRCGFVSAVAVESGERRERPKVNNGKVAVVWFKQDLRTDDHPGLVTAASCYRGVVPLYVFDRRILARFSDEMVELLLYALGDLKQSLKDQGSDLMIRFGSAEIVLQELLNEVTATSIFAEEEVEYNLRRMMAAVEETLMEVSQGSFQLVLWQASLYDIQDLKEMPESYCNFKKMKFPLISPLASPILPGLDMEIDWGALPTFSDVKRYINGNFHKSSKSWISIREISSRTLLRKENVNGVELTNNETEGFEKLNLGNQSNFNSKHTKTGGTETSVFISRSRNLVAGGTNIVLNALTAYLRYLEGTTRDDWKEVHEKLCDVESRNGASFGALFGPALSLGVISRRRVHYEAIKYERERNAGFLSPFGYSAATVAAAVDAVCSMEWYWLISLKSVCGEGKCSGRIWRWKGHLIQYKVAGHEGPAILLVHGFGAFLEHYRDNIYSIAGGGNRVWAVTLLGFGKSEKPNIVYTELMWAEMLRDFIVDVVGEPAHLVGNSIGGYIVALVAGLWPALAKSVVLINTAGPIIPDYSFVPLVDERRNSGTAWLGGRLLSLYLRLRVGAIVKNCYPTNPERADDWLVSEMIRASYDPGVLAVLESVFNFNLSIPLNYLLGSSGEKVLIIQGTKDPISNSELKLQMLREHCHGFVIREIDAGHCPHDECPEEVNHIILEWIARMATPEANLTLS